MRTLLLTLGVFVCTILSGQSIESAKAIVKTLCSPQMKGRGYVDKGDFKAANYISEEFEKLSLRKYSDQYFQTFTTPVNSFPGKMELTINKENLIPGVHFLVDPASPGIKGRFKTVNLSTSDFLQDTLWMRKMAESSGQFIVINDYKKNDFNEEQLKKIEEVISFLRYHPDNKAAGTIILTREKLTWSGSTEVFYKPVLMVRADALNEPIKSISIHIKSHFHQAYHTQNIIGYVEGEKKDSMIVLTAHYDHLGMMGSSTLFPGANDNASGIAMLLSLANYYTTHKPEYTTVFIAFAAEEIGLIGSQYFVNHPVFPLAQIKFLINFDISGTGDDGIQVVNGKIYQDEFNRMMEINERMKLLKQIKIRGEACNSDHCLFYRKGVPCFFIYTLGGIQAYHDIYDKAETLPLTEFEDYFKLITEFLKEI